MSLKCRRVARDRAWVIAYLARSGYAGDTAANCIAASQWIDRVWSCGLDIPTPDAAAHGRGSFEFTWKKDSISTEALINVHRSRVRWIIKPDPDTFIFIAAPLNSPIPELALEALRSMSEPCT